MSHSFVSFIYLLVTYGSVIVGMRLRSILPDAHLSSESKDSIKVGVGLIATMSALVLGLITASAKSSFDNVDTAVKQAAAQVLTLDRLLARYGPETTPIRAGIKKAMAARIKMIWGDQSESVESLDPIKSGVGTHSEELAEAIRALTPDTDAKKSIQSRALDLTEEILQGRWTIFSGNSPSVSTPLLLILLLWLTVSFLSFGLFAPRNTTVLTAFFICAISVATAIFLILELDSPFSGLLRISPGPMNYALSHLDL